MISTCDELSSKSYDIAHAVPGCNSGRVFLLSDVHCTTIKCLPVAGSNVTVVTELATDARMRIGERAAGPPST
jgi:hypothetical protein